MKTSTLEEQFASSLQLSQLIFQDTVKSLKLVLQVTLLPRGCTALMHVRLLRFQLQRGC